MFKPVRISITTFLGLLCTAISPTLAAPATQPADVTFLDQVTANFVAWDLDHDGALTANEIELAVDNPSTRGPAAAAAAALRRAVRADGTIAPLTLEKIAQHVRDPHDALAPARFDAMYASALKKIRGAPHTLFVSGQPKIETLGQGRLGDCFLLASLGSLVDRDPKRLSQIMHAGDDGKVDVSFADGHRLHLACPTDAEIAIGASTLNDGLWANMFEKAVGTILLDRQKKQLHATPYSIIGVGGSPHIVMEIITGHKIQRLGCEGFQGPKPYAGDERGAKLNEIRDELVATQKAGRLVAGGTAGLGGPAVKVPGLYFNHSYAVLNYDRASDVVTFWNPMGNHFAPKSTPGLENGYVTSHGRFEVPLNEAVQWFGAFSFETNEPLNEPAQ